MGSITDQGFEVVKDFAEAFLGKLRTATNFTFGIVQFGNGALTDGKNTVTDALGIMSHETDITAVEDKVASLKWQKGFTNMAQGAHKAKDFLNSGRDRAKKVVVFITDGIPSYRYATK